MSTLCRTFSKRSRRSGFSLLELSLSIVIVSLLMLGLFSSIGLVTSATRLVDGPVGRTTHLMRHVEQMSADIRLAQTFIERSPNAVEMTVPDRDGDSNAEIIRYHWAASTDRQLTKTITYSRTPDTPATTILDANVRQLDLSYLTSTYGPAVTDQEIESDEVLLLAHDDRPSAFGQRVLFMAANPSSLNGKDAKKVALMENWGFVVEPIAASESATVLQQAFNRNDVVYISESTQSTILGNKATSAPIGIVCEEPYLCDELGFASDVGDAVDYQYLGSSIGTHYLTQGWLPGDAIQISTKKQDVRNLSADPARQAADLEVLATRDGEPALCVLQRGARIAPAAGNSGLTAGETAVFPLLTSTSDISNDTVATKITINDNATLSSITANLKMPYMTSTRFAVYADTDGRPTDLIAQTEPYFAALGYDGWVKKDFSQSITLEPGDYWLAIAVTAGVRVRFNFTGGSSKLSSSNSKDGFMASWSGTFGPEPNNARASVYLTYDVERFAAGRRVMLPWGSGGFDIDHLNEEGRTLMRRALQWAADRQPDSPGLEREVHSAQTVGQYLAPPLPSNATGWQLTRMFCRLKRPDIPSYQNVNFRLLSAGLDRRPSPYELQETSVVFGFGFAAQQYDWFEIPFATSGDLRVDRGVCLTIEASGASAAVVLNYDDGDKTTTLNTQMLHSFNQGSTWAPLGVEADLRFYLYGRYQTRGEPQW